MYVNSVHMINIIFIKIDSLGNNNLILLVIDKLLFDLNSFKNMFENTNPNNNPINMEIKLIVFDK